jgi:hypothetical protein
LLDEFDGSVGLVVAVDVENVLASLQPRCELFLELLVGELFENSSKSSLLPCIFVRKYSKRWHDLSECLIQVEILPIQEQLFFDVIEDVFLICIFHGEHPANDFDNVRWHFVIETTEL